MAAVEVGVGAEVENSWSTAVYNMATGTEEVMDFGEAVFRLQSTQVQVK